jgi:methionyl-tRNA formyltransferase
VRLLILADSPIGADIVKVIASKGKDDVSLIALSETFDYSELISMGVKVQFFSSYETIVRDFLGKVDLGLLAWWPKKVPQSISSIPTLGFVNAHPSFLPYGRGKDPNFWALVEGSPFGVSVHKVTDEMDAGPVIFQTKIEYDWTDTGGSLYEKAILELIQIFRSKWEFIKSEITAPPPERETLSVFTREHFRREMLEKSVLDLDEVMSVGETLNLLRAKTFPGREGCLFSTHGQSYSVEIKITKVET